MIFDILWELNSINFVLFCSQITNVAIEINTS